MERKEETDTKNKWKERKIDCNLLYNIKERKSGAKPEGIRKKQEITLHYTKMY